MMIDNCLTPYAKLFEDVPQHVLLHPVEGDFVGPGGSWEVAFWLVEPDLFRVAIVPLEDGRPVALVPVWRDPQEALVAASKSAKIAAEI